MKKSVLIIKGHSKTEIELTNDKKIIQLYIDFFNNIAGGAFEFETEINVIYEPTVEILQNLSCLNSLDYLIVILLGHGAIKENVQVFQLQENTFIQPGQLQFDCKKQLHLIETCRDIIDFELDIKRLNQLIPKYKYGGKIENRLSRELARERIDKKIENSEEGILYLFAASKDESAHNYLFITAIIDVAVYIHEYHRKLIVGAREIFEITKPKVIELTKGKQNPIIVGEIDLPFVITII